MATWSFYAGENSNIHTLVGSGLGFFGDSGFGYSVEIGGWQGRTFITDSGGTIQGPEADNVRVLVVNDTIVPTGCILGQSGSGINLLQVPNERATLNIRLTHDTPVRVQNVQLRIYDRVASGNPASGVTTAVAEIIHPDTVQNLNGSGSSSWTFCSPTGTPTISLISSPGTSGLRPSGSSTVDTRHDWYLALSASPSALGTLTQYGLYVRCEYL